METGATTTAAHSDDDELVVDWVEAPIADAAVTLERAGIRPELARLLARRGVETPEQAEAFLEPSVDQLLDPDRVPGIGLAVDRLEAARDEGEPVAIVGDYDADGITGTALLAACLRLAGCEVVPILPHRLRDGYGFQPAHVERAVEARCRLIVTVDCGMSSGEAIDVASSHDIDVIVTDHHLPSGSQPEALAIVNPKLAAEDSGANTDLCGAGIALKVGMALLERVDREVPVHSLLRVACLGTVADLVPLTGENRTIAALGLQALGSTRSPGLRALMDVARVKPPVLSDDVGFRLAPRLNAAGRLDSPDRALELLLTRDPKRARVLAEELDQLNRQRQVAERTVVEEAREVFLSKSPLPRVLVAASENWHRGVVGIAAGRLARSLHRPTILLERCGAECVGSGRSIQAVHLHRFLLRWRDRMSRFGGHSQAVGMTLASDHVEELDGLWNEAAADWSADDLVKRYRYEIHVSSVRLLRDELYREIERLQPFGQGNPAPLIRVGPLRLARAPRIFGSGHLDLMVEDLDGQRIRATGWNWEERGALFEERFEVLGRMQWDSYLSAPAIHLVDARPLS